MKKILAILILFITAQSFSQIETSLIGEWKAIAIKNESFFYHSKIDTIIFNTNKTIKEENKDMLRYSMKSSLSTKKFIFKTNDEFVIQSSPNDIITLSYEVLKENETIILFDKNNKQSSVGKIDYFTRNGILELEMTINGQNNSLMILNKVE